MKDNSTTAEAATRGLLPILLLLLVATLAALALHVRTLPPTSTPLPDATDAESVWWGLWHVTYVPAAYYRAGLVALGAAVLAGITLLLYKSPQHAPAKTPWSLILVAISLAFLASFWAFPLVHTRWGDAYILSKGLAWPDPALRITHSWQAPLDVFLHSRLWHWLGPRFGWEVAAPIYRILSPLAGALFLAAALGIATGTRLARPWLAFGMVVSLGLIQLFFGYVENYSFAAAGILAYLWLGLRTLEGRTPLWVTASVLALTHALHPSTIVLAPSLLVLGGIGLRRLAGAGRPRHSVLTVTAQVALPMLLIGGATFVWMEWSGHGLAALLESDRPGGSDGRWFVPLHALETRWEHYTMFSWPHWRDLINGQLLVAPVVLPSLLIAWLGGASARKDAADPARLTFLVGASVCYLLFIAVWNPDYGGQRDWDLFSLAALPTALLAAFSLDRALPDGRAATAGVMPLILLQALLTAAWIYSNTLPWEWPA